MKNVDAWVRILYTYGPFAILVFLVFVTERKIRTAMTGTSPGERKTLIGVYILNWVAIFSLVIFSVYAWKLLFLDRKPTIEGEIKRLSNLETLSTSSADLYLYRNHSTPKYSDYKWILVSPQGFDDGAKVKFTIDQSSASGGDDNVHEYELPISADLYNKEVHLRREQDKLFWDRQGQEMELVGRKLPQSIQASTARLEPTIEFFTTVVRAQGAPAFSADDFKIGLESSDAIIRRNTRAELSKQGQEGLMWIEKVLADPNSSYRLRLGVIVALNNMPNLNAKALESSTIKAINTAAADPDEALRNEAQSIRKKYGSNFPGDVFLPVTVYEHKNYSGRSQGFGPGTYRADKGDFGNLPNDSASSVRVATGYRVRLCESEGGDGNGDGHCEEYGKGKHRLWWTIFRGVADQVSYIEVIKR